MSVWFLSDPHIGHAKIAEIRFPTWSEEGRAEEHDRYLAGQWDKWVKPDHQVWLLGDISAGGNAAQKKALAWLADRPGEKRLISGNHDGVHPMHRDSHKWLPEYLKVFASVQPFARRNLPRPGGKQAVLLSHLPYEGEGERPGPDRFTQYRLRDEGMPILHGHTHSAAKVTFSSHQHPDLREGGMELYAPAPQIHVGLDAWDLKPVHLDELAAFVEGL